MCNIKTSNVEEVVQQILRLEEIGCEIIRVSVLDTDDANAISKIKERIHIPLVADIHFDYKLALLALQNGVDKIIEGLKAFGIKIDEGFVDFDTETGDYGPYKQSERAKIYQCFAKF